MGKKVVLVLLISLGLLAWAWSDDGFAGTLQDIRARGKFLARVRTDFPPFGFVDKLGTNMGMDVDIVNFDSDDPSRISGNPVVSLLVSLL